MAAFLNQMIVFFIAFSVAPSLMSSSNISNVSSRVSVCFLASSGLVVPCRPISSSYSIGILLLLTLGMVFVLGLSKVSSEWHCTRQNIGLYKVSSQMSILWSVPLLLMVTNHITGFWVLLLVTCAKRVDLRWCMSAKKEDPQLRSGCKCGSSKCHADCYPVELSIISEVTSSTCRCPNWPISVYKVAVMGCQSILCVMYSMCNFMGCQLVFLKIETICICSLGWSVWEIQYNFWMK